MQNTSTLAEKKNASEFYNSNGIWLQPELKANKVRNKNTALTAADFQPILNNMVKDTLQYR